ncbi:hypothetical protein ERC79_20235 [Rhodococcus sp. ABRD24]|uniref:hypothetical protein n=1 Tax=Rhodococcus sp. ABRD24 TaxID=2507582 RepID=UPI00103D5808|nr:hypothetical protein [Rhodococcus sp. ABRD24]QBJ98007.1 hypothetical protein ERC79_20235 [Rhodococcus sp. ABRD24]
MTTATSRRKPPPVPRQVGEVVSTQITDLDLLNWHSAVGKPIASYIDGLSVGSEKLEAALVLVAPDLIDWAADEYARVERSERAALPTEVLNADGCRAFGRATRLGWHGPGLVTASSQSTAIEVLRAVANAVGARYGILVSVWLSESDRDTPGVPATVTVTSVDYDE